MRITKMHALGNNYIYLNTFVEPLSDVALPQLARTLSDVRRGVGSDGMILMGPSQTAELQMRIFNADGSEAETCGNGLRCVAKYAFERGLVRGQTFSIETKGGTVVATIHADAAQRVSAVTIDMGEVSYGAKAVHYAGPTADLRADETRAVLHLADEEYEGTLVSMGNPHFVLRVPDATSAAVETVGPRIEKHPYFPQRLNVEFVSPVNRRELDFQVWERGSGITYACGTGACAAVAAGVREGWLDNEVTVHLLGGDLQIALRDGRVYMTGEAVEVFEGDFLMS